MGQGQGLRNLLAIVLVAAPAALGYALEDRPAQTGRGGELPEVSPEDDLFLDELEFLNSCIATEAHRRFCLELGKQFPDYSDDLWGITASDSPRGYVVWGGPPAIGPIDGTVVPCATGGSLPFQPEAALRVLRNMRAVYGFDAWSKYGLTNQSSSAAAGT